MRKLERTGAGIASDGSGDNEYAGTDRGTDTEEEEIEDAEAADEAIARSRTGDRF